MLSLKPVGKIFAYREEAPSMTPGGLVVPENVHRWQKRFVLEVGPEVTKVKPGDMFIVNPQWDQVPIGNEQTGMHIFLTHEDAVLAVVEESLVEIV